MESDWRSLLMSAKQKNARMSIFYNLMQMAANQGWKPKYLDVDVETKWFLSWTLDTVPVDAKIVESFVGEGKAKN